MSMEELMALVPIESAHSIKERGRKTRWDKPKPRGPSRFGVAEDKPYLPPPYVDLPVGLTPSQIDQFLREQRYDELTKKLAAGELEFGDPDIRPPSPPPIYDKNGSRTNTRDVRVRTAMMSEYHRLVEFLTKAVHGFVPPADFKPLKKVKRIEIPLEKYPEYNFMGLIIGPRGCNHKRLEAESGTQISVRGKGTQKEGKKTDHQTDEEASMPMHVHIAADTEEKLEKAVGLIEPLLDPFHPMHEEFKKRGLEQLALVNGLNVSKLDQRCAVCGAAGHLAFECPDAQDLQNFKKPQVRCAICGDMGHVTMDCKMRPEGGDGGIPPPPGSGVGRGSPPPPPPRSTLPQTPQQQYYEKMKMDHEYQKMMNELSGGSSSLDELDGVGKQSSPGSVPPGISPNNAPAPSPPASSPNYSKHAYYTVYPPPPPPQFGGWADGSWGGRNGYGGGSWNGGGMRPDMWGQHQRGYGGVGRPGLGYTPPANNPGHSMSWNDPPNMGVHPGMAGAPYGGVPMGVSPWGPIPPPPALAAQFQQGQLQQVNPAYGYPGGGFPNVRGRNLPMGRPNPVGPAEHHPHPPPGELPPLPPDAPPMAPAAASPSMDPNQMAQQMAAWQMSMMGTPWDSNAMAGVVAQQVATTDGSDGNALQMVQQPKVLAGGSHYAEDSMDTSS